MLHIQLRHNQAVYFSCIFLVPAVTAVKYDEKAAEDIRLPSPTDNASLWKDFTVELPSGAVNGLEGLFSPTSLTIPHFSHYYCLCLTIVCRVFLFLCSGFYIPGHSVQSPWYKRQVRGASLCTHMLYVCYGLKAPAKCSISLDVLFDIWQHNSQQRFSRRTKINGLCAVYMLVAPRCFQRHPQYFKS